MNTNQGPAFKPKMTGVGVVTPPFTREDIRVLRSPHIHNGNFDCSMWWLSDYDGAQSCNCGDDALMDALADRIETLLE